MKNLIGISVLFVMSCLFYACSVMKGWNYEIDPENSVYQSSMGHYLHIDIKPKVLEKKIGFFFSRIVYGAPYHMSVSYQQPDSHYVKIRIKKFLCNESSKLQNFNIEDSLQGRVFEFATEDGRFCDLAKNIHIKTDAKVLTFKIVIELIDSKDMGDEKEFLITTKLKRDREFGFLGFN